MVVLKHQTTSYHKRSSNVRAPYVLVFRGGETEVTEHVGYKEPKEKEAILGKGFGKTPSPPTLRDLEQFTAH